MFDRFTEAARRCVFFAIQEAQEARTAYLETPQLALGILKQAEVTPPWDRLDLHPIGERLCQLEPRHGTRAATRDPGDVPLSREVKSILNESEHLMREFGHTAVDLPHLLLALLSDKKSMTKQILEESGLDERAILRRIPGGEGPEPECAAPELELLVEDLERLLETADKQKPTFPPDPRPVILRGEKRTTHQVIGQMIDSATAHHQWLVASLTQPVLHARICPDETWLAPQDYDALPGPYLVNLWLQLNYLLIHVMIRIPSSKIAQPCKIGIREPISVKQLIQDYIASCREGLAVLNTRR